MTFRPLYNVMVRAYDPAPGEPFLFEEENVEPSELPSLMEYLSLLMMDTNRVPEKLLVNGENLWSVDAQIIITLVDGCELR